MIPPPDASVVARSWCDMQGPGWSLKSESPLGQGGTAPVFEVASPDGPRALKIYDPAFSSGSKGEIERKRIEHQVAVGAHECPYLVQTYGGGEFEGRLYLLMGRAPGAELEKRLSEVPRSQIRTIVDQIAQAALFLRRKELCHRDIKAANVFVSDDFERSTLLDISVVRNIYDPIGSGTDHEGQLPVLATARYSPPEYLFRLLEPGPDLWHALTVYQLGALLHDLIMRQPLFQAEYVASASNRYRFAWVVAKTVPRIQADDVDEDLLLLARRSLDKDWERRSTVAVEDFLIHSEGQQKHALQLLGFVAGHAPIHPGDAIGARLKRVQEVSAELEKGILDFLRTNDVTAIHKVKPGPNDTSKLLSFRWEVPALDGELGPREIEFQITLRLTVDEKSFLFGTVAELFVRQAGIERHAGVDLPDMPDVPGVEIALRREAASAFADLAVKMAQRTS